MTTLKIVKATSGPLAGFNVMPQFSATEYRQFLALNIAAGVQYGWGCKPEHLNAKALPTYIDVLGKFGSSGKSVRRVDCSGYQRSAIYFATDGAVAMPDGSASQGDWLKSHFKKSDWASMGRADGVIRIAIHRADTEDPQGHIWATLGQPGHDNKAKSYESYGGHGPGSRAWDANVLHRIVTEVYAVAYDPD